MKITALEASEDDSRFTNHGPMVVFLSAMIGSKCASISDTETLQNSFSSSGFPMAEPKVFKDAGTRIMYAHVLSVEFGKPSMILSDASRKPIVSALEQASFRLAVSQDLVRVTQYAHTRLVSVFRLTKSRSRPLLPKTRSLACPD